MNNSATDAAAGIFAGGFLLFIVVFAIAITVFFVWLFWRVFTKTGMNGALGLLCLIPSFGPLICLLILAFARWPIEDALAGVSSGGGTAPGLIPPASPPGSSIATS